MKEGGELVQGSSATVAMPSNFSKAAKLGVTATTYVDTRVVTIDTDVYTAYEGYGTTIATNMYGSSKYITDLTPGAPDFCRRSRFSLCTPACHHPPLTEGESIASQIGPSQSQSHL